MIDIWQDRASLHWRKACTTHGRKARHTWHAAIWPPLVGTEGIVSVMAG